MKARQEIQFYDERSEHFLFFSLEGDRDDPRLTRGGLLSDSLQTDPQLKKKNEDTFKINLTDDLELNSYDGSFDDTYLSKKW